MEVGQKQFSLFERFVVIAIILVVSAIAVQNVLHSVRASEERSINHAAVQYAAVKSMYAEQRQTVPPNSLGTNASGAANSHTAPIQ